MLLRAHQLWLLNRPDRGAVPPFDVNVSRLLVAPFDAEGLECSVAILVELGDLQVLVGA